MNDAVGNPIEIASVITWERKAAMVSNLLVVLTSDHQTQPVADELRSVNSQIEYLLTQAVRKSGRMRAKPKRPPT